MRIEWDHIPLFSGFSPAEIEIIKPLFESVKVPEGGILIQEDEPGEEMFVLVKGRVRVTKSMIIEGMSLPLHEMRDPRKVLATLDGEHYPVFGEMALIDRDIRSATVSVIEDSVFLKTDRDRFFTLVEKEPVVGVRFLTILCRRLASTVRKNNSELVKLTTALALALYLSRKSGV